MKISFKNLKKNWIQLTDNVTPLNIGDKLDITQTILDSKKTIFKLIPLSSLNSIALQ